MGAGSHLRRLSCSPAWFNKSMRALSYRWPHDARLTQSGAICPLFIYPEEKSVLLSKSPIFGRKKIKGSEKNAIISSCLLNPCCTKKLGMHFRKKNREKNNFPGSSYWGIDKHISLHELIELLSSHWDNLHLNNRYIVSDMTLKVDLKTTNQTMACECMGIKWWFDLPNIYASQQNKIIWKRSGNNLYFHFVPFFLTP